MNGTDRDIEEATLARMVRTIDGRWELTRAALADNGYLPVYHLDVETPDGRLQAVLKAAPPGESPGVALESRILRGLELRSGVPVPAVYGAVDDHEHLPAPFFLMSELPGEVVPRREMDRLPASAFRNLARQTGRSLADLHDLDVVDAFGFLEVAEPEPLRGGRPPADFSSVRVADPTDDWHRRLREWIEDTCDGLAETRFAALEGAVRPTLLERVDDLEGPFRPALGHVDGAIENHLLECVCGEPEAEPEVVGMLDWAFTLAVPPAYDLLFVEQSLAGGLYERVPSAPDVRDAVRAGLRDGYRDNGAVAVLDRLERHRDCYELFALVNALNVFESWFDDRGFDRAAVDDAAANYRAAVRDLLRGSAD